MDFWKTQEKSIVMHGDKMNIVESCVDRHAKLNPDKLALVFQGKKKMTFTYKQLQEHVNKVSNLLKKLKIKKGSRVFIFLPKCPALYVSFLATIKTGAIAAPLFEAFQTDGLKLRLKKGDADFLITNKELAGRLKNPPKSMKTIIVDSSEFKSEIENSSSKFESVLLDRPETATMIFTSSTAGTPVAGIEVPHYGLVQQHFTGELVLQLTPEDNYFCTAHPGWVTGSVYGIIAPLSIGCTTFIYEPHFDAKEWISFIKENKISVIYTAPTALRLLKPVVKKSDLEGVKNLCSVGEALEKSTFEHYKKLGLGITDTYWQTETGAIVIASYKGVKKQAGSIGKAIPGITAMIKDKTITLKKSWPAMMTGIYKHPKMYSSYFNGNFFKTNDQATLKNGYFYFVGRTDDIIKTSGERVSPIEIESILIKFPGVKEAAVIGVPDKIKGHVLKAFIVLDGVEPSEELKTKLAMFVKKNYAGHAYPKQVEFVKSLPKTNSGKIIRMKLRGK